MKILSQIATAVSGSVGGITGSHNRGGMYLRARAVPTNPATTFQQAVRNAVTTLATRWNSTLTQAQRDAWDVYAFNVTVTDRLGQSRNLSGQQHYIRSNSPRIQAGLGIVDDAPTIYDLGSFTASIATAVSGSDAVGIAFDDDDAWVDEDDSALLIYLSRTQNPGLQFFKGPYRFGDLEEGNSTTAPTSPASLTAPFPLTEDNRLFAQFRVTRADGRLSGVLRDDFIVTAI